VRLTDGDRPTVAELGTRFGKKTLAEVVAVVNPETLLAWHGKLVGRLRPTPGSSAQGLI